MKTIMFLFAAIGLSLLAGCNTMTPRDAEPQVHHQTMYGTENPNDHSGIPQSILDGEEEI